MAPSTAARPPRSWSTSPANHPRWSPASTATRWRARAAPDRRSPWRRSARSSPAAALVNIPGESSSVVTCLDGYQMARQGRAGPALAVAALGSFFAGCVSTLIIALAAPPLAEVALKFGPSEYFSLMVFGLVAATVLAHGSLIKAIAMVVFGLLLGIVGTDVNSGVLRFTFNIPELSDGIGFVIVSMGMFGTAEIVANLALKDKRVIFNKDVKNLPPTR